MEKKPSTVAWTALIISVLALVLAWTAFNRAGQDLEAIVAEQVEEAAMEMEEAAKEAARAADEAADEAIDAVSGEATLEIESGTAAEDGVVDVNVDTTENSNTSTR